MYRFSMVDAGSLTLRSPSESQIREALVTAGVGESYATAAAFFLDATVAPAAEQKLRNGVTVKLELIGRRRVFTITWSRSIHRESP